MPDESGDFRYSDQPEPHRSRTKAILRDHPEVRKLFGPNIWSFAIIVGVVAFQYTVAYLLRDQPWWLIVAVAWGVGAYCNHAMYVMIHDAAHSLIFRRRAANEFAAILADCTNVIPAAMSFRSYHLKHHAHQGVYDLDADLPNRWEARLIGNTAFGKAIWFLLFPFFEMFRPTRLQGIQFLTGWTLVNWLMVFSADALLVWLAGPMALLYLGLSFLFSIGLHPLGARWIQEHYLVSPNQETYSYYGFLNLLAFNVGYHNEHHDFASIPWNRLPELKRIAPEYYDNLISHRSWTKLWLQFIFDRRLSHFSRLVRTNEVDQSKPGATATHNKLNSVEAALDA
jgi:sphingolipid delta-4 desaturase